MITILRKELQIILKEKGTFFYLIILPIAFIVLYSSIFGSTSNSNITINYVDEDNSQISQAFIASLDSIKGFETKTDTKTTIEDQEQEIKNGKLSSLLVIPKGFGDDLQSGQQSNLEFYRTATSEQTVESINALLNNIINSYRDSNIQSTLADLGKSTIEIQQIMSTPIVVNMVNEDVSNISAVTQYVPGMMVMFVFFIIITMIRGFTKERESGMLSRLRSTPMKPYNYLFGMWSSFVISVIIQCSVILVFGYVVYKLDIGNIYAIMLIVIALAIAATGIGLAISFLVKGETQGIAITQIIVMGGAALGGLWFPFDILPSFAQKIGYCTPQYWAQTGLQDVMVRGANVGNIAIYILVLLLFGVVGTVVALLRFKHYILQATN